MTYNIHEQYLMNDKGEKTAVLLPFKEYKELIEDLHDLAEIVARKNSGAISFKDLQAEFNK
jgi:hypothetical protein